MHEHNIQLKSPTDRALYLWVEPWAEGVEFPAGSVVELNALSLIEGKLELDVTNERTAVYGWPGSTLRVLVQGTVVRSFETPVPEILDREMVSSLFGSPPVPTLVENQPILYRLWSRFFS